jgi:hypothetical protein
MIRWAIGPCMLTRLWAWSWRMLEWILTTFNHRSRVWKRVPYDCGSTKPKYDCPMRWVAFVKYWRKVYARLLVNCCSGIGKNLADWTLERKPLCHKDLRRNRAAPLDVTPYDSSTYSDPKGSVAKCCSKMRHL